MNRFLLAAAILAVGLCSSGPGPRVRGSRRGGGVPDHRAAPARKPPAHRARSPVLALPQALPDLDPQAPAQAGSHRPGDRHRAGRSGSRPGRPVHHRGAHAQPRGPGPDGDLREAVHHLPGHVAGGLELLRDRGGSRQTRHLRLLDPRSRQLHAPAVLHRYRRGQTPPADRGLSGSTRPAPEPPAPEEQDLLENPGRAPGPRLDPAGPHHLSSRAFRGNAPVGHVCARSGGDPGQLHLFLLSRRRGGREQRSPHRRAPDRGCRE